MPEHVHLIVWPREPVYDIADIRKAIKSNVGRSKRNAAPADAPEQPSCRNGVAALLGPAYESFQPAPQRIGSSPSRDLPRDDRIQPALRALLSAALQLFSDCFFVDLRLGEVGG